MTILLRDPRVAAAVPVHDVGEPLEALDARVGPARAPVRRGLVTRLEAVAVLLPSGVGLLVVEGHRDAADQRAIIARCSTEVCAHRDLLASVLRAAGLVNHATEWWHWSFGDRYRALLTGPDAAAYGPVERSRSAA